MVTRIKLHSGREERFEEIKADLEERRGYEPSNPRVVDELLEAWDD
jgi:hypothetical protein